MAKPTLIYPSLSDGLPFDESRIPKSLREDINHLFEKVKNWRTKSRDKHDKEHYKKIVEALDFSREEKFKSLNRKKPDLSKSYETEELTYKVVVEIETSTIENGYNDLLKILQLLKSGEIDYGVVIFVQNNRGDRAKLTEANLRSNLEEGLSRVLDDFRGKLLIYHVNVQPPPNNSFNPTPR